MHTYIKKFGISKIFIFLFTNIFYLYYYNLLLYFKTIIYSCDGSWI